MATLRNAHFLDSPLSVDLVLEPAGEDGWCDFTLTLFDDAALEHRVIACSGSLASDDYARLADALELIASGTSTAIDFAPFDPAFLVRSRVLGEDDIEFIWMADKGFADTGVSTDTGVAIVLTAHPAQVKVFADELARESSRSMTS